MNIMKAYELLEINENASESEVKRAYAKMSAKYHPEEYPNEFQEIYKAFELIKRVMRNKQLDFNGNVDSFESYEVVSKELVEVKHNIVLNWNDKIPMDEETQRKKKNYLTKLEKRLTSHCKAVDNLDILENQTFIDLLEDRIYCCHILDLFLYHKYALPLEDLELYLDYFEQVNNSYDHDLYYKEINEAILYKKYARKYSKKRLLNE